MTREKKSGSWRRPSSQAITPQTGQKGILESAKDGTASTLLVPFKTQESQCNAVICHTKSYASEKDDQPDD